MPTFFNEGGFRGFIWSYDCRERPHIHVEVEGRRCKFWLVPTVELHDAGHIKRRDLAKAERLIRLHLPSILAQWDEHCGTDYATRA